MTSLHPLLYFFSSTDVLQHTLYKGEILAVISAFCWAISASIYKKGLETTNPWSGNLIRSGCAALGFFIFMGLRGTFSIALSQITGQLLFWLVFSAFFAFFLGDLLFLFSLKNIGVSRTVPISSTFPLFAALWSFLVFRKPVSILVIIGTVLIVIAIKLISEESTDANEENRSKGENSENPDNNEKSANSNSRGFLWALSAAICWSVSIIVLDYLVTVLPVEAVAGIRFLITFLLTTAIVSRKEFVYNKHALLWIGIGGAIILLLGNYIFLEALRLVGSGKVAPISAVYPVISVAMAAVFLRERITPKVLGGTFLSFLGVILVVLG